MDTDQLLADLQRRIGALERDLAALHEAGDRPGDLGEPAPVTRNATFEQAIELFLSVSPWVSDQHTPYVTAMFKLAQVLDNQAKPSSAAVMEFRQNFNDLRKCAPAEGEGEVLDPLDQLIADAAAGRL